MACQLLSAKLLSEPRLPDCQYEPKEHISVKYYPKSNSFFSQEEALANTVWEMAAIFSGPQYVNNLCKSEQYIKNFVVAACVVT